MKVARCTETGEAPGSQGATWRAEPSGDSRIEEELGCALMRSPSVCA